MRTDRTLFEFKNGWMVHLSESRNVSGVYALSPSGEFLDCPGGEKDDDLTARFAFEISQKESPPC